ncbi:hypothetical protein [Gottfriedia acidiceleris]|uniref:hypothetical protein n=1 Tax=Gottfriedia acidiceleris TaxID=371036 RepID=UPI003D250C5C
MLYRKIKKYVKTKYFYLINLLPLFNYVLTFLMLKGKSNLKSISEITELLKDNYVAAWEDREQQLKHHIYNDKNNKIILKVIYSDITNEIVWIEISSTGYTHSS